MSMCRFSVIEFKLLLCSSSQLSINFNSFTNNSNQILLDRVLDGFYVSNERGSLKNILQIELCYCFFFWTYSLSLIWWSMRFFHARSVNIIAFPYYAKTLNISEMHSDLFFVFSSLLEKRIEKLYNDWNRGCHLELVSFEWNQTDLVMERRKARFEWKMPHSHN